MRASLRLLLFTALLLASACSAAPPWAPARGAPESFAPLVRQVLPAVVNIAVTESVSANDVVAQLPPELRGTPFEKQFRERFRNRQEQISGAGSGFIIDPDGLIVTNYHVVGRADRILVSLANGAQYPAHVIGSDDLTDIALIRVAAPGKLPFLRFGDSNALQAGDWILAAGNPFGLGGSVTAGIVSARGRDIGAGPFDDFLQLDAPINPGNSGGPTFNMDGQVVGMNTAIVSPGGGSVGIGFAIPSAIVSQIVMELRSKGHIDRGWLGATVEDRPATDASGGSNDASRDSVNASSDSVNDGVGIAAIDRNGPAAHTALRVGDVVLAVNGEHVDSSRNLVRAVAAQPPGSVVRLSVRRAGQVFMVLVTVGRRPPEPAD